MIKITRDSYGNGKPPHRATSAHSALNPLFHLLAVPVSVKTDKRTVAEVQMDIQARKRQKLLATDQKTDLEEEATSSLSNKWQSCQKYLKSWTFFVRARVPSWSIMDIFVVDNTLELVFLVFFLQNISHSSFFSLYRRRCSSEWRTTCKNNVQNSFYSFRPALGNHLVLQNEYKRRCLHSSPAHTKRKRPSD